jgi:primase-polymerase (primpol)-like protein
LEHSRAGDNFKRLWKGEWQNGDGRYASQSEADLALVAYLVFMVGADPPRIDRMFRRSGLDREKWDRDDYRDRTIKHALAGRTSFYCRDNEDQDFGSDHVSHDRADKKPFLAFENYPTRVAAIL